MLRQGLPAPRLEIFGSLGINSAFNDWEDSFLWDEEGRPSVRTWFDPGPNRFLRDIVTSHKLTTGWLEGGSHHASDYYEAVRLALSQLSQASCPDIEALENLSNYASDVVPETSVSGPSIQVSNPWPARYVDPNVLK